MRKGMRMLIEKLAKIARLEVERLFFPRGRKTEITKNVGENFIFCGKREESRDLISGSR